MIGWSIDLILSRLRIYRYNLITILLQALLKLSGLTPEEERKLLSRVASGDVGAFSELYERYHSILYRIVYSIVKQKNEAEDLLQEIFNQIWQKASSFESARGSAYTWLSTISRNKALDFLRSRSHKRQLATDYDPDFSLIDRIDSGAPTPHEQAELSERARHVQEALSEIPPEQQEVIRIAYFEGYSQSEIAERLGLPLGTVKTRARQALIKLEASLAKRMRS